MTDSAYGIDGLHLAAYGTDLTDAQWARLQGIERAPAAPESYNAGREAARRIWEQHRRTDKP